MSLLASSFTLATEDFLVTFRSLNSEPRIGLSLESSSTPFQPLSTPSSVPMLTVICTPVPLGSDCTSVTSPKRSGGLKPSQFGLVGSTFAGSHGGQSDGLHCKNFRSGGLGHGIVFRHDGMFGSGGVGHWPAQPGHAGSTGMGHLPWQSGLALSNAARSHGFTASGTAGSLGGSRISIASQSKVSTVNSFHSAVRV